MYCTCVGQLSIVPAHALNIDAAPQILANSDGFARKLGRGGKLRLVGCLTLRQKSLCAAHKWSLWLQGLLRNSAVVYLST